jgi:uncharacterized protein YchJ
MKIVRIAAILLLTLTSIAQGQQEQTREADPTALILELRTALLARQSASPYLSPQLSLAQRQKIAESVMRPYLTIDILYNPQDLVEKDSNHAVIAVRTQWETAKTTFNGTRDIHFVNIGGRWYFADLDFMSFPWVIVVVAGAIGIAFAVLVLTLVQRSRKQQNPAKISPLPV